MSPATPTDRLLAIQALASVQCVAKASCIEQHAGVIARLLDAEDPETTLDSVLYLDASNAVLALRSACEGAENDIDPRDYGAQQDRDTGVWDYTDRYDSACEDARELAARAYLSHVRTGIAKDLYALTPDQVAAQNARIAATVDHVGAMS